MTLEKSETLEEFYKKKFNYLPQNLKQDIGHFNVFKIKTLPAPMEHPPNTAAVNFAG